MRLGHKEAVMRSVRFSRQNQASPLRRRAGKAPVAFHLLVAAGALFGMAVIAERLSLKAPDFQQACREGKPYYVVASYRAQSVRNRAPDMNAPSIMLFQDTSQDSPHYVLANYRQVGTVWGLAYSSHEPAIYAATYHKRAMPYGPEGAGAIYRVDLKTGSVSAFAQIPNAGARSRGSSFPDGTRDFDGTGARQVGRTALGDLDINADETELFVTNLADGKIYRVALSGGTIVGSFDHGAVGEPWADSARPFGLAFHNGKLFHGVVNSLGSGATFVANIYRSEPDGSDMTQVASLGLTYARPGIRLRHAGGVKTDWRTWQDALPLPNPWERPERHQPQPMLTDLAFTANGQLVIGLRDRFWDIELQWIKSDETVGPTVTSAHGVVRTPTPAPPQSISEEGLGFGDILRGIPDSSGYSIQTDPEHFDDTNALGHEESAMGGLAALPGANGVAAASYGVVDAHSDLIVGREGIYWYDVPSGNKTSLEPIGRPGSYRPYEYLLRGSNAVQAHCTIEWYLTFYNNRDIASLGDVEVLCIPEPSTPTPTPTEPQGVTATPTEPPPTAISPTPTAVSPTPTDTPTAPPTPTEPPTVTPTRPPPLRPVYLPVALREECQVKQLHADVALVIDASLTMTQATRAGRSKLEAARDATEQFVRHLAFPADQATIISFNVDAYVLQPLTGDRDAVLRALGRIRAQEFTRIDLGLQRAHEQLMSPARIPDNQPVIILLTDGMSNPVPGSMAVAAAEAAKADGILVYAIGLGEKIDAACLRAVASDESCYHHAPDGEDLAPIYDKIAVLIPCRPESFWGRR